MLMPQRSKEKIRSMFDGIARDYDRLNHLMSLDFDKSWRKRALKEVLPARRELEMSREPRRILDLACGTGDFSIAIAQAAQQVRVTGVDLSEGMLAVMREKVALKGLQRQITCTVGDSEALPFGDGIFNCATIAFGIRNFENREKALREILRVLKPGGRLVILELSVPTAPLIRGLYKFYFTKVTPMIGGLFSGDKAAYRYLPASVLAFPGKEKWMATMEGCGFSKVRHKAFTFGICRMYTGEKA